ncbi:uncharacterized protein LOC134662526 [Cydia amplana]|uniref:uncharacterized protein LOC134662526 n=1 Tax=Cydia amplana TaxID=1869771 RepID=UPI002FE5F491
MLQFIDILKSKTKMNLQTKHILAAERLLLQRAQSEDFADELRSLRRGEPLTKGSALFELDPELAADNVLRMRGRIDAAPVPINKRPAILHGRNRYHREATREALGGALHLPDDPGGAPGAGALPQH